MRTCAATTLPASGRAPTEAIRGFLDALAIPVSGSLWTGRAGGLYRSLLADRRMLIVLDNARDAAAGPPAAARCCWLLVLVTSRSQLTGLAAADGADPLKRRRAHRRRGPRPADQPSRSRPGQRRAGGRDRAHNVVCPAAAGPEHRRGARRHSTWSYARRANGRPARRARPFGRPGYWGPRQQSSMVFILVLPKSQYACRGTDVPAPRLALRPGHHHRRCCQPRRAHACPGPGTYRPTGGHEPDRRAVAPASTSSTTCCAPTPPKDLAAATDTGAGRREAVDRAGPLPAHGVFRRPEG